MVEEIWKYIEDSKDYEISNLGRIRRAERHVFHNINKTWYWAEERILKPSNNNSKKYWRIEIVYKDGKKKVEAIHRLVAKAFIPNPENLPQVNHIDGDKNNNKVENLEWISNQGNIQHGYKIGLFDNFILKNSGELSRFNKYPVELIKRIPQTIIEEGNYKKAAKKLGIPSTLITEIKSKRAWKTLNIDIPDSPTQNKKS